MWCPHSPASSWSLLLSGALGVLQDGSPWVTCSKCPAMFLPCTHPDQDSVPGLAACRGEGCAMRAPSRSSGAFLLPWGLCGTGAVGLGDRRRLRRCRPRSTSAEGAGTGTASPGGSPLPREAPGGASSWPLPTFGEGAVEGPEPGVALQVVVLEEHCPEVADGGDIAAQEPGEQRVEGTVGALSLRLAQRLLTMPPPAVGTRLGATSWPQSL